ncbi:PH domain-containing protein [Patescibacteria group bacterium]|nr:PH domain-containing protein [Patescibacteria group bacterium]MBU1933952.1 PH domain-containing protein [Patescibacteria group bacterium]MBU2007518.1 PH domain-containing protein [Patescibacteria group bacterium]MBU2264293.1 PH domain-containing protein [Patescibacteria group bacterium]
MLINNMLKYRLPGALPGEKIIKILRKDLLILFGKFILTLILAGLPALVGFIMLNIYPNLWQGETSYPLIVLAVSGYVLFIWLFLFFSFIDYYLDVWLITSQRIIDIRQEGFFSRTVAELKLSQIQDVTSELKGVLKFIFRFGDVYVQTAGEVQRFTFRQIPHPEEVRDIIIKLVEENKRHHAQCEKH